jgi:hypothetical protein
MNGERSNIHARHPLRAPMPRLPQAGFEFIAGKTVDPLRFLARRFRALR